MAFRTVESQGYSITASCTALFEKELISKLELPTKGAREINLMPPASCKL